MRINIRFAGSGGQGVILASVLLSKAYGLGENYNIAQTQSYGPEARGGSSKAETIVSDDRIHYTSDLKEAVTGKSIVVFAVPTQQFRSVSSACADYLEDGVIAVNLAKGIEQKTLKRLSEIASETIPSATYVALSGPSHAEEIVRNFPAGVVVCSKNRAAAEHIQDVFMSEKFRIYTQEDMIGVEIAGAVKNVIAITTGISDGMKLGSNARAALMTRAVHEIKRLGTAVGAESETFSGLSGIGDLIVTCSTNLSRNRRCGLLIGLGLEPEDAVKRVGSVVEGYYILKGELAPEKALSQLMSRSKKDELA